jgi:hypothetical protein
MAVALAVIVWLVTCAVAVMVAVAVCVEVGGVQTTGVDSESQVPAQTRPPVETSATEGALLE